MSYLRLYQPDVEEIEPIEVAPAAAEAQIDDEPVILSFEQFAATWRKSGRIVRRDDAHDEDDNSVGRARVIYANRRCPYCKNPMVEPLELANARLSRNRMPVPGTATLVGFHCGGCCREWPA